MSIEGGIEPDCAVYAEEELELELGIGTEEVGLEGEEEEEGNRYPFIIPRRMTEYNPSQAKTTSQVAEVPFEKLSVIVGVEVDVEVDDDDEPPEEEDEG